MRLLSPGFCFAAVCAWINGTRAGTSASAGGGHVRQQSVVAMVAHLGRADGIELQIFVDNAVAERREPRVLTRYSSSCRRGSSGCRSRGNADRKRKQVTHGAP